VYPIDIIAQRAKESGLRFLVIGGQALSTYGNPRATIDVDLLIPSQEGRKWKAILEAEGFRLKNDGGNFVQFTPPYGVQWPLDLMLVNELTFAKLHSGSRAVTCLGIVARVPAPVHLVALKLHALVHGPPSRQEKDFPDIVRLARMTNLDPQSPELLEVFKQYGTQKLYVRFLKALEP
jgi:hypothetical protein